MSNEKWFVVNDENLHTFSLDETDVQVRFEDCSSLTHIPPAVISKLVCNNVRELYFYFCPELTLLPSELIDLEVLVCDH
jgi:hypothetical protein